MPITLMEITQTIVDMQTMINQLRTENEKLKKELNDIKNTAK